MTFGELLLVVLTYRADGGGDPHVALVVAELELVVTARGVLAGYLNALQRYEHALLRGDGSILEVGGVLELLGEVNSGDGGLVLIDDLDLCIRDLVCAAVCGSRAGDANGHTYLDLIVGHGVGVHLVDVITAVVVLEIEAVGAVALGFCHDTGHNALDDDGGVVGRGNVISP